MFFVVAADAQTNYYSKSSATNFSDVNSWGTNTDGSGASPSSISNADNYIVNNNSALTLNANASVGSLTINSGSLTVASNTLAIAVSGAKNSTFSVAGGTLTVTGGAINLDGSLNIGFLAAFNQSGGTIRVDGNNGGSTTGSVGAGTPLVSINSFVLNLSGGTILIVDPHAASGGTSFQYSNDNSYNPTQASTHTVQFGDPASTDATASSNGFFIDTWFGSSRFMFANLTLDPGNSGNRAGFVSNWSFGVARNLTINSGVFKPGNAITVGGNITNNGVMQNTSTVALALFNSGSAVPSLIPQTISGSGTFRNTTANGTSTANFSSLTVNNLSAAGVTFADANSVLSANGVANTGTVSGTMTFTAGTVNLGGKTFIVGISATATGTLSWTSGGFAGGSYKKFFSITALPSTLSSSTPVFPFVSNGNARHVYMARSGAWTAAGSLTATYNDASGINTVSVPDAGYTIDRQSAASWAFAAGDGANLGATTLSVGIAGEGIFALNSTPGTAPRLMQTASVAGAHVAATGSQSAPIANRSGISPASLTADAFYIGMASTDLGFYTVASGNWEDGSTWSTGVAPAITDVVTILDGHVVTVNGTAAAAKSIVMNGASVLNITGSSLTIASPAASGTVFTTGARAQVNVNGGTLTIGNGAVRYAGFQNNGVLSVASGTLNVNGFLINSPTSSFIQSGGAINIDQNAAGSTANSFTGGAGLQLATNNITLSGGTLTIVDPNPAVSTTSCLSYTGSAIIYASTAHTLRFGDGISTDPGGNATGGFRLAPSLLIWGNVTVDALNNLATISSTSTSRVVTSNATLYMNGDLTITSGELNLGQTLVIGGNVVNNGTLSTSGTLQIARIINDLITTSLNAQSIGGTGFFRNGTGNTASLGSLTVNNSHASGLTLNRALSVGSTLTMTIGVINTSAANTLTLGTATSAGTLTLNSPSATTMIKGPFVRMIPASQTGTTTYIFPVGKSAYTPFDLVNPVTNSGGAVAVRVEAFDGSTGGTPSSAFGAISNSRYWEVSTVSGSGNFTSSQLRLNDTRGSFNAIGRSGTQGGTYQLVGGGLPALTATSITTVSPVTGLDGFYLMATTAPPVLSNLNVVSQAGDHCSASLARDISIDVTPAAGSITSVVLSYSVNGTATQTVNMTNSSGNTWIGTIPSVTPSNGSVNWRIVVTDDNNLSATQIGSTYQDNPLSGFAVTLSASPATICAGASSTITASASNGGATSAAVGAGAGSSSSMGLSPFYHGYGGAKTQYIIRGSEMTAAGFRAGAIKSMTFEITSLGTTTMNSFSISMGQTTATALTANTALTSGLTTVYSNAAQTLTSGVNSYTFTTPFAWDGYSNIVVSVVYSNVNTGGTSSTVKTDAVGFTASVGIVADNASATALFNAASDAGIGVGVFSNNSSTSRPRMTFTMAPTTLGSYLWSDGSSSNSNTFVVTPASTTAYYAIGYELADMGGCATDITATPATVNVNPVPSAPGATNSTQCGIAVPTASVTSTSGLSNPTFKWYDAADGGNLLQSGTSATYTSAINNSRTFYVSEVNTATGCEGERTAVTVTVTPPDAVAASTSANNVCPGTTVTLNAQQTGSANNYTYTWTASPVSGSGIPTTTTGASAQVVPAAGGTFTYTVTAVDGSCTTTATTTLTVIAPPVITTATGPLTVCPSSPVALTATSVGVTTGTTTLGTGSTAMGGSNNGAGSALSPFSQYYESQHTQYLLLASDLQAAGLRAGNISSVSFNVTSANPDMLAFSGYTMKMSHTSATSLSAMLTPAFTTVYGPASLSGATSTGAKTIGFTTPFNWNGTSNIVVDVCFANDPSGNGTFFTSNAAVNGTTVPYTAVYGIYQDNAALCGAASSSNTANTSSVLPNMTFAGQVATDISASANFSWTWSPGGFSGSSATATSPANNSGAPVNQVYTVTLTDATTTCSASAQVTVSVNPTPSAPTASNSSQCGLAVPTASVTSTTGAASPVFHWYDAATNGRLLQNSTSTTYTTAITATTTFYVSEVSADGCESARTPVVVTVTEPDAVSASANGPVCANGTVNLSVNQTGSANTYSYTWSASPASGSGIPTTLSGGSQSVMPTAAGTYVYTLTAVDGSCTASSTVSVTVNPNPVISTATGPTTVCSDAPVALSASSISISAGTIALGTESGTNGTNTSAAAAYPTWFGNVRQQWLVKASELHDLGLSAGNLTSLAFDVVNANGSPATLNGYTIKIQSVASSTASITTMNTGAFTTVWGPQNYTPVVGVNTHSFSTPFNWDGTSSLIIEICFSNQISGSGSAQTKQSATSFVSTVYDASDATSGASICTSSSTLATASMRPNLIIGGQVATDISRNYSWTWNPGGLSGASVTATAPNNAAAAPASEVYTVTATNAFSCFSTSTVSVAVSPAIPALTASNSVQCGLAVPAASVASASGAASPVFHWYDAPTGGTMLQNGTSTTYTTAINTTTTFYVSEFNAATGCESPRTAVTATVNAPDAVTASSNGPVCLGSTVNLNVAQTGSTNNYTYSWTASPVSGSGMPAGASGTSPSVAPTAAGTYVYTVTAVDGACTTTSTVSVTVNANPNIFSTSALPTTVCAGGAVTLSATAANVLPGTATIGTDNASTKINTDGVPYRTGSSGFVRNQYLVTAAELSAMGLQPGSITSLGFVVTSASGTMNNMNFKMAAVPATALTGTFLTPTFTTVLTLPTYSPVTGNNLHTLTTPFTWDGSSNILVDVCGQVGSGSGCTMATFTTTSNTTVAYGGGTNCTGATGTLLSNVRPVMLFGGNVNTDVTANYSWLWTPGNLSGATVNATTPNTSGTVVYTVKATDLPTGCFATATVSVTVGAPLVPNASASAASLCVGGSSTLSAAPSGGGAPFLYSWKDAANTVIGTSSSVSVSPATTSTYTVTVTDNCSNSVSQNVTVTVNELPTVSINERNPVSVCAASASLSANTAVATPSYQWTLSGSNINLATAATHNATASGAYSVKVTDPATGCTGTSTAVTVNLQTYPTSVTVTPSGSTTICLGQSQTITSSATFANGPVTIMSDNFDSGSPSAFTISNGSGASNTRGAWTVVNAAHTYGTLLTNVTIDGSKFILANSDAAGSGSTTQARLTSNAFSTVGFTAVSVAFKHFFRSNVSNETFVGVEYSLNGTTWSTVPGGSYTSSSTGGADNPPTITSVTLNLPSAALNQPSVRIRFRYDAGWDYYWGIDDVRIQGTSTGLFSFASTTDAGLTSAAQSPNASNNSISVTPTAAGTYTYTVTASVPGNSCTNTSTVTLHVLTPSTAPSVLNASVSSATCAGSNVILTQTGGSLGDGAHWQWYRNAAFTQAVGGPLTSANAQITVNPAVSTTYYLRSEGGSAPCAANVSGSATVTVSVRAPLSAHIAAANPVQCETGMAATLNISAGPASGSVIVTTNGANPQTVNLDASGNGTLTSDPLMANSTFTIISVSDGTCTTAANTSATVFVGSLMANPINNQSVCANTPVASIGFTGNFPAGTQYAWTATNGTAIGLAANSGTGTSLPAFTAVNTGNAVVYSDVSVTPMIEAQGCKLRSMVFRIFVKPAPSMSAIADQTLCAGTPTSAVTFTSPVAGASFAWTNSNPAIGLAAGGGGTGIAPFPAQNNTASATISGTIAVTPTAEGCSGAPVSFTITVNRSVASIAYAGSPFCALGSVNPTITGTRGGTFAANLAGLNLSASTGQIVLSGSLPGTYTVTYTTPAAAGACGGVATTQVTIKPQATVNAIPNQVYCNGTVTAPVAFNGTATSFSWINDNPAIGLAASGTGSSLPSFTTVNAGPATAVAYIKVTPLGDANTCVGKPIAFRFAVDFCPPVTQAGGTGSGDQNARMASQVVVGPNPTTNRITLNYSGNEPGPFTVQLLSQQGQVVTRPATFSGSTFTLDLTGLTPGSYVLRLVNTRTGASVQRQIVKL